MLKFYYYCYTRIRLDDLTQQELIIIQLRSRCYVIQIMQLLAPEIGFEMTPNTWNINRIPLPKYFAIIDKITVNARVIE